MYDIIQMFILGLVIGLTGALAPGPTLVATINTSISGGWTSGPKIMIGHMVAETVIFFLIVLGLATLALPYMTAVALIGGISLILFGVLTLIGMRQATLQNPGSTSGWQPVSCRSCHECGKPLFLDMVVNDWQCDGDRRIAGRACACRGLYGRTLVRGSWVVHDCVNRNFPGPDGPVSI